MKTNSNRLIAIFVAIGIILLTAANPSASAGKEFHSRIFVDIAKETKKSVVSIQVKTINGLNVYSDQFSSSSFASGFFINKEGVIVTNKHVISKGIDFTIQLSTGEMFPAILLFQHPDIDLALLKINADAEKIYPLKLGNSSNVEVGEMVIAIGNPFGLSHTVTMGIVSAIERKILPDKSNVDFIQTDAAINPGNSGGPLINLNGEAIGINTVIIGPAGNIGLGFAIPINIVKEFLEMTKKQKFIQGWIGAYFQKPEPELLEAFGQPKNVQGALVSRVEKNSPAEIAGLKQGDVITRINGVPVSDHQKLAREIKNTDPGETLIFDLLRNGKTMKIKVAAEKKKEEKKRE